MARITALETCDVRFPTSRAQHGSDAMTPEPDYAARMAPLLEVADDYSAGDDGLPPVWALP